MKILIGEEDSLLYQPLSQLLIKQGHSVQICHDFNTAWQFYQEFPCPLVFINLDSYALNGLQLLRMIRSSYDGDSTWLIGLTQNLSILPSAVEAGMDDYYLYPLQKEILELRLQLAQKQIQQRQSLFHGIEKTLLSLSLPPVLSENTSFFIINEEFLIISYSPCIPSFFNLDNSLHLNEDIRNYLPELIGTEEEIIAVLKHKNTFFELQGIFHSFGNSQTPNYINLKIESHGQNQLKVLIENVTEQMILKQLLLQRANESQLLLQQVEQQREFTRQIISLLPDALLITNQQGIVQIVNQAMVDLLGYSEVELLGQCFKNFICKYSQEIIEKKHEYGLLWKVKCYHKNGKLLHISFSYSKIQLENGEDGLIYVGRDMTDYNQQLDEIQELNYSLQQKNDELKKVNDELESFSHTVSHDLRTPLTHISIFTQLIVDRYEGKDLFPDITLYLTEIQNSCTKMANLIRDLLQLSYSKHGKVYHERVFLSYMVQSILDDFKKQDPNRQLVAKIEPDLEVIGDERLLKIALDNLLSNAWKYTKLKKITEIEFGVVQLQQYNVPVFFLKDNGVGFDSSKAKDLFTPFKRLHSQVEFEGTGIGLATVQRIIYRHGGNIWAESVVNKGTTFYFILQESSLKPTTCNCGI